jgi:hypothetical protein
MEKKELFRQTFLIEIVRYTDGSTEVLRSFPLKSGVKKKKRGSVSDNKPVDCGEVEL